jgi:hypothetical protein
MATGPARRHLRGMPYSAASAALKVALGRIACAIFAASGR